MVTEKIQAITTSGEVRKRCQAIASEFEGADPLLETCELVESVL